MPDAVTTDAPTTGAIYTVPDYVVPHDLADQATEGFQQMTPLGYLDSGFLKMLDARDYARSHGAYRTDLTLTSFFSDVLAWSNNPEYSSREFAPALQHMMGQLGDDEVIALRTFFHDNATLLDDLLTVIDDQHETRWLDRMSREDRRDAILPWAQFNQGLAAALYHASNLPPGDPERIKMESFTSFFQAVSSSGAVRDLGSYHEIIGGAQAQAAMMNTLGRLGCFIIVPDFNDEAEMKDTDLKGVDFAAVTPGGKILLIDAKGRVKAPDGTTLIGPHVEDRPFTQYSADRRIRRYLGSTSREIRDRFPGIDMALGKPSTATTSSHLVYFPTSPDTLSLGDIVKSKRQAFEGSLAMQLPIEKNKHEMD